MKAKKKTFFILLAVVIGTCLLALLGCGKQLKGVRDIRFGIDIRGGIEAVFEPVDLDRVPTETELEAARSVIETRLDNKNILEREVTVDKKAGYIIVRFPWKSDEVNFDPKEAIAELGETAQLTFRDPEGNVLLDGSHVKHSSPAYDENEGAYIVQLEFDEEGAQLFAEATEKLVGSALGIYMDEVNIRTPRVTEKIPNGQCIIQGMTSSEDAMQLAEKINAGALPFSMDTTNYSAISPTLGNGALRIMVIAGLVALAFVCLFMICYYRLPGFISCIALMMQVALQLLAISVPQFALTLPGMAGIILSIGTAVDANIIISERISEELAKGATIRQAIKRGYDKAFSSVFDGNFTSAIVAILLMIFGSGSMLSFGYTLLTGLVINFVAGIFISKHMLSSIVLFKAFNKESLFIKKKERKTIPFYNKRKIPFVISSLLMVIGLITCFMGGVKLDTQFAGGAVLKYNFVGEIDTKALSTQIEKALSRTANLQITTDPATNQQKLVVTLAGNKGLSLEKQDMILDELQKSDAQNEFTLSESYIIEPYIGKAALKDAAIAIILSAIFIVLYVWFRFKSLSLSAGVMAVVALIHDIMLVFFVFGWFGIPLNDAYVAVTLTIIGYSINDTIVLYDRIRENNIGKKQQNLGEIVSRSITQTLSRSINTSFTTIMCVVSILVFSILYGIDSIKVFALPMLFGLLSGCYSSICIAGPLWVMWQERKVSHKGKQNKTLAKA